jgi:hypothetical protein
MEQGARVLARQCSHMQWLLWPHGTSVHALLHVQAGEAEGRCMPKVHRSPAEAPPQVSPDYPSPAGASSWWCVWRWRELLAVLHAGLRSSVAAGPKVPSGWLLGGGWVAVGWQFVGWQLAVMAVGWQLSGSSLGGSWRSWRLGGSWVAVGWQSDMQQ